jgi:hypothetical protein
MITGHKGAATFEQYRQIRRDAILQAGRKLEKAQRAKKVQEAGSGSVYRNVYQALTDAQSVKLLAEMRQIVFRGLGGILGLFAATAAVIVPVLFVSNSLNEAGSVRQNGGHFSLAGAIGGSLAVLILLGLFVLLAFTLLRFAFRGPKEP